MVLRGQKFLALFSELYCCISSRKMYFSLKITFLCVWNQGENWAWDMSAEEGVLEIHWSRNRKAEGILLSRFTSSVITHGSSHKQWSAEKQMKWKTKLEFRVRRSGYEIPHLILHWSCGPSTGQAESTALLSARSLADLRVQNQVPWLAKEKIWTRTFATWNCHKIVRTTFRASVQHKVTDPIHPRRTFLPWNWNNKRMGTSKTLVQCLPRFQWNLITTTRRQRLLWRILHLGPTSSHASYLTITKTDGGSFASSVPSCIFKSPGQCLIMCELWCCQQTMLWTKNSL